MIHKKIFIGILVLIPSVFIANAQTSDTIDLFQCYKLVKKNAPQSGLLDLNRQSTELEIRKLNSTNLPSVSGYGKATCQSDAVSIPGPAGIEINKFQYNTGINVDQKIFDGGLVSVQKDIKQTEGEIKNLETESALYKMNDLVNKYFFGIITLKKSIGILNLRNSSLNERRKNIGSGVKNGMILKSELDRVESEILSTNQQITEIQIALKQMEDNLKTLAGLSNDMKVDWELPEIITVNDSVSRYENAIFEQNRNYTDELIRMKNKRYVPHLYAFGQTGYSYPGLDMFNNEPAGYYIVGVKLSWQIFDWNQSKKDKQLLEIQKDKIDINEADFNRNLSMQINSKQEEINKMQQLVSDDQQIIDAKAAITKASASALDNGTITTADYINDLNAELKARFDFERHKISLSEATADLAVLKGINIDQL